MKKKVCHLLKKENDERKAYSNPVDKKGGSLRVGKGRKIASKIKEQDVHHADSTGHDLEQVVSGLIHGVE